MHRQFCRTVVHEPFTIRCHLQSYNIVVSKEVKRRIEYIMSFEKDVARLLIDSEMNEDDKFYFAETLVYNAMRLIDNEALHPFSEMIERYYHIHECGCCRSYNLDSVFVYEWKELQDCFYQQRKKILALTNVNRIRNGISRR